MAQNDYKRRLINQLPAVLQTDTLKNFFAATIDNLFQPGTSEAISGYIGQKPSYYDPTKDFYLAEPTAARAAYQLEPAMVSINSEGTYVNTLCYDDLINYLRSQGSLTANHSRMFEGEYYSWSPPVDLDKLNNYLQYVWMGSLSEEDDVKSLINLRAPVARYSYDGNTAATYEMPEAIPEFSVDNESPVALVDGKIVAANFVNGVATIATTGLPTGTIIEIFRYGSLTKLFSGLTSLNLYHFLGWTEKTTSFVNDVYTLSTRQYYVGELVYNGDKLGNGTTYRCITAHTAGAAFDITKFTLAAEATTATTSMRANLIDAYGSTVDTGNRYMFDGIGSSIVMSPDFANNPGGSVPHYVVIDRRSEERSPWALRNLWVHKSALAWTGDDFLSRKAQRPIIEFLPNLELYNYGTQRQPDAQGSLSSLQADIVDNWNVYSWDDNVWDMEKVNLSMINGKFFGKIDDSDDTVVGSVMVDNGYILQPNDRLFVHQTDSNEPELNNRVYSAISNPDTPLPSGATADVVELVLTANPTRGDIIRIMPGKGAGNTPEQLAQATSVFTDHAEFWYNGVEWVAAQTGADFPLFMLFDSDHNALNDANVYYNTDFAGSKLFSYQVGTGTDDTVLGFPMVVNSYGQPIFQIDPIVNRTHYDGGTIGGYYYHHFLDDDTYSNNWFAVATPSSQDLVDGVYTIPTNLQSNPGNFEVEYISRNQWFDHFSEIMEAQDGFTGHPYSTNNWRDTAKEMGFGEKILQHRSPLLKTMLIASQPNFDLPAAIRYVEQEYVRFRNRFVQTLIEFYNNGTLQQNALPNVWVDEILSSLRLNKTAEFPFALSNMAGGQYFIPATPASFGLSRVAVPQMVVDTTYATPVTMIRGHDGSLVPAFGDLRDPIMLALETRIYDNIDPSFKTDNRPVFDMDAYLGGKFYDGDYTPYEIDAILSPSFERWAQSNRLDYRANNGYDPDQPFTWNFSSSLDYQNRPLPGNWRGIYRLYFDTDRPHLAPWEMLGFIDKPTYWEAAYGPAPYTLGNTKMWDDIRDGAIIGGNREGVNQRYARPALYDFIPVDDQGRLLDPIAAKIVATPPTYQDGSSPWKMGDHGPVENLWRQSPSFGFAMALVGFLTKPSRFVEQGWDTINTTEDSTGQWIYGPTGNRPLNKDVYVHGELNAAGTARIVATGVQQWIGDYLVVKGQDPKTFGDAIRGLDVRLAHKMAGFSGVDNLRAMADNFGLIPSEDVAIEFYRSPSTREEFYSGVLIEWTGRSYRVIGYDTRTPYFSIIQPELGGPKSFITLSDVAEPIINTWQANRYYQINTTVSYGTTVYRAMRSHTSGNVFDPNYWNAVDVLTEKAPRVTTYGRGNGVVTPIPYGTEFYSTQEIADFMLGYERYLESRGWIFDQTTVDGDTLNWSFSVKEFLSWAQVDWAVGSIITLSPSAANLKFETEHGMVLDVLTPINGAYGMIERTGKPIERSDVVVNRIDGSTELLSKNSDIFGARLNLAEIEHVLFFSNKTIFNDIIYEPLFNLRQPRLRIIGRRTTNWTGRLDAPGYMLLDGDIASNFYKAADDLLMMFDIEQADNVVLRDHARHITGYDSRDYLSSLVLSEVEQFEFYQGMIHQKGAPGAFDKLLRSDFIEQSRDLKFFEEWALKIDEYGARNVRSRVSFELGSSEIQRDPQLIHFRTGVHSTDEGIDRVELVDSNVAFDAKWVERPQNPLTVFPKRETLSPEEGDLPVAGYVRLDEVEHIVFDYDEVPSLYDTINNVLLTKGETVWVHDTPAVTDASNYASNRWYTLGDFVDGNWDGSNNTIQDAGNAVVTNSEGRIVFRSKPNEAPFVTNDSRFDPVPGHVYMARYSVRKIVESTNGIASYVRPAFDAFPASGAALDGGLGVKSGPGYDATTDLIDTSGWQLGKWYDIFVTWTCPSSPDYSSARARLRVNRALDDNADEPSEFPNAVYEVSEQGLVIEGNIGWDAYRIYNLSADGAINTISNVVTRAEDDTVTTLRIFPAMPHGLTDSDIGGYVVIAGSAMSDPDIEGVQVISAVSTDYFEVLVLGEKGFDFVAEGVAGPELRVLRSARFKNMSAFNSKMRNRVGNVDGDLAYVDGSPWRVFSHATTTQVTDDYTNNSIVPKDIVPLDEVYREDIVTYWKLARQQPKRMDASRLVSALIYDQQTNITDTELQPEPLTLSHINLASPLTGKIVGKAESEIDFKLEYDPAIYTSTTVDGSVTNPAQIETMLNKTAGGAWGKAQVGRVWWDLTTVRFLETETDDVAYGISEVVRYENELNYRGTKWGTIAPKTSVDIYEWVRSMVSPTRYTELSVGDVTGQYRGQVYNETDPDWVETVEYDPNYGSTTIYYFWVKNREVTPFVDFRLLPTATVARLITNPQLLDLPWIAPIMPNSLLVGGAGPFLDDKFGVKKSGTVLQVEFDDHYEGVVHEEWMLMRPEDERSLPTDWMWDKMRDSLAGFDNRKNPIPAPMIPQVFEEAINLPPTDWGTDRSDNLHPLPPRPPIWVTAAGPITPVSYNVAYTYALLATDPDDEVLTFALANNTTLPYGLTLSNSGVISGTTNAVTTSLFDATVWDGTEADPVPRSFSLAIANIPAPTWITQTNLGSTDQGEPIASVAFKANGGVAPITYAIANGSTIPPGLVMSPTFVLTGAISAIGTYNFTLIATDGVTAVPRTFTMVSQMPAQPPVWVTTSGSLGTFSGPVAVTLVATDADSSTITYSVVTGSLPAGVTLNSATGDLLGTVTEGLTQSVSSFTVRASDGVLFADRLFSITVSAANQPPVWVSPATGSIGTANASASYSTMFVATDPEGAAVTYQPAMADGTIVANMSDIIPGLSLNSTTGAITGSPTVAGIYAFRIYAVDPLAAKTPRDFSLTINPAVNLPPVWSTNSALGSVGINSAYTMQLVATDPESQPLNYVLTGGALPAGLTMNTAGKITGTTPNLGADQTYTFTVAVSDGVNTPVARTFTLTVNYVFVADATPDPLNWTNSFGSGPTDDTFYPGISAGGNTNTQVITGINVPITIRVNAARALANGENLAVYQNGVLLSAAGSQMTVGETSLQFVANNNDPILFRFGGFYDTTIAFTVVNVTDGNAVLDTFTSTVDKTNDITPDALNWTNISAAGATDDSFVPGVSVGGNTNSQTVTGIDLPITLSVTCSRALVNGENFVVYQNGSGVNDPAAQMITGESSITFSVVNNDAVLFRFGGFYDTTVTFTVRNVTDSNNILDTFTATIDKTN